MTKPFNDITGQRFNLLTAVKHVAGQVWRFSCVCGNEVEVQRSSVIYDTSTVKSCGCLYRHTRKAHGYKMTVDIAGERFGNLTAIELVPLDERAPRSKGAYWKCQCDCGNLHTVRANLLRSGQTTSCGCKKTAANKPASAPTQPGDRYGRLTAVERVDGVFGPLGALWILGCDCGNVTIAQQKYIRHGTTTSCGCAKKEALKRSAQNNIGLKVHSP